MSKQIVRAGEWLPGRKCMSSIYFPSIFHLHMSGGCVMTVHGLMGIFVLESSVCQRSGGPAHSGAVVKPKSTALLQGVNLFFKPPGGTPRGRFSVIALSWYSCGAGQVGFLLQHYNRGDLKGKYMHILSLVSSYLTQVLSRPGKVVGLFTTIIMLLNYRPPDFIRFVYF